MANSVGTTPRDGYRSFLRALAIPRLQAIPPSTLPAEQAHRQLIVDDVKRFLEQGMDLWRPAAVPAAPPGAPIGDTGMDYLFGLDRCFVRNY